MDKFKFYKFGKSSKYDNMYYYMNWIVEFDHNKMIKTERIDDSINTELLKTYNLNQLECIREGNYKLTEANFEIH